MSRKADDLHVDIADDDGTISVSAGTKKELDHCMNSAIKVREAGYAQKRQQQQQGFEHELALKRMDHEEKKEARAHDLQIVMARLQPQPSTPRQDSSCQDLFRHDVHADVHHQVTITPGATPRKRLPPKSAKSQKRPLLDHVGEDGKPEPGSGRSSWTTVARFSKKESPNPTVTSKEINDVLEGQCAGNFVMKRGWESLAANGGGCSFTSAQYRCACAKNLHQRAPKCVSSAGKSKGPPKSTT
jgi:hypothetical protein